MPILAEFRAWLDEQRPAVLPKGPIGQATTYTLNQWDALVRYTEDGGLAIDNNISERTVKIPAIGRKNWLFVASREGTPQPVSRIDFNVQLIETLQAAPQGLTIARCEDARHSFLRPLLQVGAQFFWAWPVYAGERIAAIQDTPEAWTILVTWLSGPGWEKVSRRLLQMLENPPPNLTQEILKELQLYLDTMHHHLLSMQKNIDLLAPWLSHFNQQPPLLLTQAGGPLAEQWQAFRDSIPSVLPTFGQAVPVYRGIKKTLEQIKAQLIDGTHLSEQNQEAYYWCQKLDGELDSARLRVETLLIGYRDLAARANAAISGSCGKQQIVSSDSRMLASTLAPARNSGVDSTPSFSRLSTRGSASQVTM